jgi:hypothetical protein
MIPKPMAKQREEMQDHMDLKSKKFILQVRAPEQASARSFGRA